MNTDVKIGELQYVRSMWHSHGDVARAADDDGVRHEVDVGTLEDARHLVLLVLVDRVEVCHGLSSAGLRGLYFSSQLSLCFYAH